MLREDLFIRPDLFASAFPLHLFQQWIKQPIQSPQQAQQIAKTLFSFADQPDLWLQELIKLNGTESLPASLAQIDQSRQIPQYLPLELKQAVSIILSALHSSNETFKKLKQKLTPQQLALLERHFYKQGCRVTPAAKEADDLQEDSSLKQAVDVLNQIDLQTILQAGVRLMQSLQKAKEILMQKNDWHEVQSCTFSTEMGLVEIGGTGHDIHQSDAALMIDLAGNDLYQGRVAAGIEGHCSIVLDLEGDDIYLGDNMTQGWGCWGIGILWDVAGDDLYRAGHCSQGAGIFGIGLLIDQAGADNYIGASFVQAAAFWGIGGLIDANGDDLYQCWSQGQAYAETKGIAVLCELSGSDKYLSGSHRPDYREPDMQQSFAQGFAMGVRNVLAGGLAMLIDRSGNDYYQCQYFGQGASYWMGIGILYDEYGKDTYTARRYAQGAGIHFSIGLLLDVEGDDHTYSWGVSQGCGHDLGIGILVNESGHDTYVADWLSMGASEANGIGLFSDHDGNDGYETRAGMAVGDLVPGRKAGGIGLFMDTGGQDRYSQKGQNNSIWSPNRWSIGLDLEAKTGSGLNLERSSMASPMEQEVKEKNREETTRLRKKLDQIEALPSADPVPALLSIASEGYHLPIGEEVREKLLALGPKKSIPAVMDQLGTPDIMTLLFMEDFFKVHAYQASPLLKNRLAVELDPVIKARLAHYLGQIKDTGMLPLFLNAAKDPSWRVRAAAVRAIGETFDPARVKDLRPLLMALKKAATDKQAESLAAYLRKDDKRTQSALSVLRRAMPLDSVMAKKMSDPAEPREERVETCSRLLYEHQAQLVLLLETWLRDIERFGDHSQVLMLAAQDQDPEVKRAAAYSLGQVRFKPSMPALLSLLSDPYFMVRDSAGLGLVYFGNEVVPLLETRMQTGPPALIIIGLDILGRINGNQAEALIGKYLTDPDEDVQRSARRALAAIAARKSQAGVDAANEE